MRPQKRLELRQGLVTWDETTVAAGYRILRSTVEDIATADEIAHELLAHMQPCSDINQMEMAGSYRRGRETVHDLDLLVDSDKPMAVMDHLGQFAGIAEVIARGDTKMAIRLVRDNFQIDLRVVPAASFGAALQYFTGSKEHNVVLRGMAKDRGLKINEYGVYRRDEQIAGAVEAEVYAALELPCFVPELREARHEFAWAEGGELPRLIELSDIRRPAHAYRRDRRKKHAGGDGGRRPAARFEIHRHHRPFQTRNYG